jgi:membrane dipeptidase
MHRIPVAALQRLREHIHSQKLLVPNLDAAIALHERCDIVDLHIDPLIQACLFDYEIRRRHRPGEFEPRKNKWLNRVKQVDPPGKNAPYYNHVDLPRMIDAGYAGACFAMHWYPSGMSLKDAWKGILPQSQLYKRQVASAGTIDGVAVKPARNATELRSHLRDPALCFSSMLAIEGFHCLGNPAWVSLKERIDRIEQLHRDLGVAYLTINHHSANDAAHNSWSMLPLDLDVCQTQDRPLTQTGVDLINALIDLGIMVDLSHTNRRGILDACRICRDRGVPAIATHAGALSAFERHDAKRWRMLDPKSIHAIAQTGGCVGVAFAPDFLTGQTRCSLRHVAQHVLTIINTAPTGAQAVCFGSDFDGWITSLPDEMQDCTTLPLFTAAMLESGIAPDSIQRLYGQNFLDCWTAYVKT